MSKQKFEGSSVEDALQKAADEMGVEVGDLEHELVGEKADDFWGSVRRSTS